MFLKDKKEVSKEKMTPGKRLFNKIYLLIRIQRIKSKKLVENVKIHIEITNKIPWIQIITNFRWVQNFNCWNEICSVLLNNIFIEFYIKQLYMIRKIPFFQKEY